MKAIRKIQLLTVVCLMLILAGCSGTTESNELNGSSGSNESNESTDLNNSYPPDETEILWTDFPGGVYRITTGGRHVFSGNYRGQILIDATRNDVVELVLDGFRLYNPNGPAIYAPRSRRVEIVLSDGTVNTVTDGVHLDREANSAIYIQHDLIISGRGVLNVTGNYGSGIRSQDYLTIRNGVINVTSVGDALRGRDGVIIEDGVFTLNAEGDGVHSNNDTNPARGFITINGGTFDITAKDDGIQAVTAVTINGGDLNITVGDDGITSDNSISITGGSINIIDSTEGIESQNITISGGIINVNSRDDGINARNTASNQNVFIRISGGYINVHSQRDGLESDGNIYLTGGVLNISGLTNRRSEGNFIINGGNFVNTGNEITISDQSIQPIIIASFNQRQLSGTVIEIKDAGGSVLLSYTAPQHFIISAFSSPDFITGETYSLYINGTRTMGTVLDRIITNF